MFRATPVVRIGHLRPFTYNRTNPTTKQTEKVTGVEFSGYVDRGGRTDAQGQKISDRFKFVCYDPQDAANILKHFSKVDANGNPEKDQWGNYRSSGRNIQVDVSPQIEQYEVTRKAQVRVTLAELEAAVNQLKSAGKTEATMEFDVKVPVQSVMFLVHGWSFVDQPRVNNAPVAGPANPPTARIVVAENTDQPAEATGQPAVEVATAAPMAVSSAKDDCPF